MRYVPLFALALASCGTKPVNAPSNTPAAPSRYVMTPIPLPGATGAVSLDYLACDRTAGRVWVPAGDTGSVDVLDIATGAVTRISGFETVEREMRGKKRRLGPSSATVGEGFAYVGNRATSEICAVDAAKLTLGACVKLPLQPDGIQYVAATKEVWVTAPHDKTMLVLDASQGATLSPKATIALDGEPEGYAVDEARGVFYTNLEDKDQTLAIDVRTHKVTSTWPSQCGPDGPRGLALVPSKGYLIVACTTSVEVLDVARGGTLLGKLDTGAGVDNIDYVDGLKLLYVAAGKAATLTVARVGDTGTLEVTATASTAEGTRVVVADRDGKAFVADPMQGRLLTFSPAP